MASTQAMTLKITPKVNVDIKECMAGTSDWFGDYRLDVTPMPIEVAAGKDITLDGEITIKQIIEEGSTLALKLVGEVPVIGKIPIPCLEVQLQSYIHKTTQYLLNSTTCSKINLNFRSTLTCILDPVLMTLEVIFCHSWKALVGALNSCQKDKLVHFH